MRQGAPPIAAALERLARSGEAKARERQGADGRKGRLLSDSSRSARVLPVVQHQVRETAIADSRRILLRVP